MTTTSFSGVNRVENNSDNPNCSRTWATFRIMGRSVNPDAVTAMLELSPSRFHRRGDQRNSNSYWSDGLWSLSSKGQVISTDLAKHIGWLLDRLEPMQTKIEEYADQIDVERDIFCFWESATGNGGPSFSPWLLARIASMDLTLGLDIYFAG